MKFQKASTWSCVSTRDALHKDFFIISLFQYATVHNNFNKEQTPKMK